ncbi:MAG TPA: DUF2510 domain-containing protein [Rhodoglobus sp.]|nr:DUF2510 domain-containing protein [Rhodoglobus sp.]
MADENKRAGWYPDPDGGAGERWWNGASWSDSRRGAPAAAPVRAAAASAGPASVAPHPVIPVPPPATVIYSAANPAPQALDPYAPGRTAVWTGAVLNAAPGRTIDARVNRFAFYGFITGIISVFFNVLFVLAPLAIVFSIMGIARARQLKAQGAPATLMTMALIGLGTGAFSLLIGLIGLISVIAGVIGSMTFTAS